MTFFQDKPRTIFLQNNKGVTFIELIIVLAIMSISVTVAYSTLRIPKEKIVCKKIYSVFQLAKIRAISSGHNSFVDFDMNGGNVSDGFYTTYLDTDNDSSFGEQNNAKNDNEFTESQLAMSNGMGEYPAVEVPSEVSFGLPPTNPPALTPTGGSFSNGVLSDGVGFAGGSKRIKFLPKGIPSGFGGSVYVHAKNDSLGRSCAVIVASTGIVRMWSWDGSKWN